MASINSTWHGSHPAMRATGSFDYSISGTTINVWGNVTNNRVYSDGSYGYNVTGYIVIGGVRTGDFTVTHGSYYGSTNFSGSVNTGAGNKTIQIHLVCGQSGGCDWGYPDVIVGELTVYVPDPYTPSSIWLNPNDYTKIGRVDVSSWSFHYSYNAGSNSSVPITLAIHDYNATSWGVRWEPKLRDVSGSSAGVWDSVTLRSAQGFTNANRYRVTLVSKAGEALSPNSWNPQDGYPIYTYQKPVIGTNVTINLPRQNANTANSFTIANINNRMWTAYESEFQTRYRLKRGSDTTYTDWGNAGNVTTWTQTAAQIRSLIPKQYDNQNVVIEMKRYSPSADWWSDETATGNFVVLYRPQIGVTGNNVIYRRNSNAGSSVSKGQIVINDSNLSGINVAWAYDDLSIEAGYTQGYRIRLYDAKGNIVKTYYTQNQDYTIPKADIPRIQLTKLDITPYFANDSTDPSQYWYYNKGTIEIFDFIILSSDLAKPVIDYPVQNADWLNPNFRLCFTLPVDADKGYEDENYRYENIEVQINGSLTICLAQSEGSTQGAIIAPECFSALVENLTYLRKIVINPSACSSFPTNINLYSIRIRVKKKYGANSVSSMWTVWSDVKNITVTRATFNPNVGDIILASHYNNAKALINRVRTSYNINWVNIPQNVSSKIDIIYADQYPYTNLIEKITAVKNLVNNYGPFDEGQEQVKFDYQNAIENNFTPTNEIITALSNEDDSPNGRNYIKIIYDRCNRLL